MFSLGEKYLALPDTNSFMESQV